MSIKLILRMLISTADILFLFLKGAFLAMATEEFGAIPAGLMASWRPSYNWPSHGNKTNYTITVAVNAIFLNPMKKNKIIFLFHLLIYTPKLPKIIILKPKKKRWSLSTEGPTKICKCFDIITFELFKYFDKRRNIYWSSWCCLPQGLTVFVPVL